jgi:hypothetical protein
MYANNFDCVVSHAAEPQFPIPRHSYDELVAVGYAGYPAIGYVTYVQHRSMPYEGFTLDGISIGRFNSRLDAIFAVAGVAS